jgi:hypothetical protein
MRQDLQSRTSSRANAIRQLYLDIEDLQTTGVKYTPFFYAEVRLDFNDVRTGFRATVSLNQAAEIHQVAPDLLLSEDMIRNVDPKKIKIQASEAIERGQLPDFVDAAFFSQMETQFIHFLLRSYKARVYRNCELDTYSNPGESFSEFCMRCLDLLYEPKRLELDTLHEIFTRRLEQIRQKYLNANSSDNIDLAKEESHNRNTFLCYSDSIADLFLQPEAALDALLWQPALSENCRDMEAYLASLKLEAQRAIAQILDLYEQKARAVDEYILHPNLKDIHFERCCILWIPIKAA